MATDFVKLISLSSSKVNNEKPSKAFVSLIPKFVDINECDDYKVNHMLSFWKNFK